MVQRIEPLEPRVLLSTTLSTFDLNDQLAGRIAASFDGVVEVKEATPSVVATPLIAAKNQLAADVASPEPTITTLAGTGRADLLVTRDTDTELVGRGGNDTIIVHLDRWNGEDSTLVRAGKGDDTIYVTAGKAEVRGGAGYDILLVANAEVDYRGVEEVWILDETGGTWTRQDSGTRGSHESPIEAIKAAYRYETERSATTTLNLSTASVPEGGTPSASFLAMSSMSGGGATSGDLNSDGNEDATDIDLLVTAINAQSTDLTYDLNFDGVVTKLDQDYLIRDLLGTEYGDGNLDGQVSDIDYQIWSDNFNDLVGWAGGDYSGNGIADAADYTVWADHYGFGVPPLPDLFDARGDLNANGAFDPGDVELMLGRIGQPVSSYPNSDLFTDGVIDQKDLDHLVMGYMSTRFEDLNLDGKVDNADGNILFLNFQTGPNSTWSQGDLNGDGYVDLDDYFVYSASRGFDNTDSVNLTGTPGDDILYGYRGYDTIDGGGGNDFIWGGQREDTLDGGDGIDTHGNEDPSDTIANFEAADADGDGLSNIFESQLGTDPAEWDSDADYLSDGWEYANWDVVNQSLNPLTPEPVGSDADGDGLSDYLESIIKSAPNLVDTDGDGATDGEEYYSGTWVLDARDKGLHIGDLHQRVDVSAFSFGNDNSLTLTVDDFEVRSVPFSITGDIHPDSRLYLPLTKGHNYDLSAIAEVGTTGYAFYLAGNNNRDLYFKQNELELYGVGEGRTTSRSDYSKSLNIDGELSESGFADNEIVVPRLDITVGEVDYDVFAVSDQVIEEALSEQYDPNHYVTIGQAQAGQSLIPITISLSDNLSEIPHDTIRLRPNYYPDELTLFRDAAGTSPVISSFDGIIASDEGLFPGGQITWYLRPESEPEASYMSPFTIYANLSRYPYQGNISEDTVYVALLQTNAVDLDIDSDNNNWGQWVPTETEDLIEESGLGKVIVTNTGDRDGNGYLDYADGFNLSGGDSTGSSLAESMLTLINLDFDVPGNQPNSVSNPLEDFWIEFEYDESSLDGFNIESARLETAGVTPPNGGLRLWRAPEEGVARNGSTLSDANSLGDLISTNTRISLADFVGDRNGVPQLLVEAINASDPDQPYEIMVSGGYDDGEGTVFDLGQDTIWITAIDATAPVYSEYASYLGIGEGSSAGDGAGLGVLGPIRLDSQVAAHVSGDLKGETQASTFGVTRSWTNDLVSSLGSFAGTGQLINELPFLLPAGGSIIAQLGGQTRLVFDLNDDDTYSSRFFGNEELTVDGSGFLLRDSAGNEFTFNGFGGSFLDRKGRLASFNSAYGESVTIDYIAQAEDSTSLHEIRMTQIFGGTEELWSYIFQPPLGDDDLAPEELARERPRIDYVTRSRDETEVSRATYAYYDSDDNNGERGDLKSVTIDDLGINAYATYHYVYEGSSSGKVMYELGPEAAARGVGSFASGQAVLDSGGIKVGGDVFKLPGLAGGVASITNPGTGGYTLNTIEAGSVAIDPNAVAYTTTATRHDGRTETFTLNHARQVLSHTVNAEGTRTTTYIYDERYRLVDMVSPGGLTTSYEYFPEAPEGVDDPNAERVKRISQTSGGHTSVLADYTYQQVDGAIRVATETLYTGNGANPSGALTTTHAYSGLNNHTITQPVVTAGQNGTGAAYSVALTYDAYGNLINYRDEDGYNHSTTYSFAVDKTTVTSSVPGLSNAVAEYDIYGRLTRTQSRNGLVEINDYSGSTASRLVSRTSNNESTYAPESVSEYDRSAGTLDTYREVGGQKLDRVKTQYDLAQRAYEVTRYSDSTTYITDYAYDQNSGQLYSYTDPSGVTYVTQYDGLDRVISESVDGHVLRTYEYDNGGVGDSLLTEVSVNPGFGGPDRTSRYVYDWRNRLVATKEGNEGGGESAAVNRPVTVYAYDNLDRLVESKVYDGDGYLPTYSLGSDSVSGLPGAGDLALREEYFYDGLGRIFRSVTHDPQAGHQLISEQWYDGRANILKQVAPGGLTTKTEFDDAGRATDIYLTDDASGGLTASGDTVLEHTSIQYDDHSNPIFQKTTQRNESGADRVSAVSTYYDLLDRTTAVINHGTHGAGLSGQTSVSRTGNAQRTDFAYGSDSLSVTVTDPRGVDTYSQFDALGRTIIRREGVGETAPLLDADDNAGGSQSSDSIQRTTKYEHDGLDRVVEQSVEVESDSRPASERVHTTTFDYLNDGTNSYTMYLPGYVGADVSGKRAFSRVVANNYVGQQVHLDPESNLSHVYTYDALGRLIGDDTLNRTGSDATVIGTDVRERTYAYDVLGRNTKLETRDDGGSLRSRVTRDYNAFGQLTQESSSNFGVTNTTFYHYEAAQDGLRPTGLTYPDGRRISYTYGAGLNDAVSRISGVTESGSTLESYLYLGLGTPVAVTTDLNSGDELLQSIKFDAYGRVQEQQWDVVDPATQAAVEAAEFHYSYDKNNNLTLVQERTVDPIGGSNHEGMGYDGLNRLTHYNRGGSIAEDWNADTHGLNRSIEAPDQTLTQQQADRPTFQGQYSYDPATGYSADLSLAVESWTDSLSGSQEPERALTVQFDAWGRVIERANWEVDPDIGEDDATFLDKTRYIYDAAGRMIRQVATPLGGSTTRDLVVTDANGRILENYRETDDGTTTTGLSREQYVWSPVTGQIIVRHHDTNLNGTADEVLVPLIDSRGNTVGLVDSDLGSVVARLYYAPSGEIGIVSGLTGEPVHADIDAFLASYDYRYLYQQGRYLNDGVTLLQNGKQYDALQNGVVSVNSQDFWKVSAAKTGERTPWYIVALEVGHVTLDLVGLVPGIGIAADLANGAIYSARGFYNGFNGDLDAANGHFIDGGFSFGAAVPILGYASNAAKYGNKATKLYKASRAVDLGVNFAQSGYYGYTGVRDGNYLQAGIGAFGGVVNTASFARRGLGVNPGKVVTKPAAVAVNPGKIAAESDIASQEGVLRALRSVNTPEAKATAQLIKRGKIRLDIRDTDPYGQGAAGRKPWHSNVIEVYRDKAGSSQQAAGIAAHETKHWLQKIQPATYRQVHEFEAYQFQRRAGFLSLTDNEIRNLISTSNLYKNVPK